MGQQSPRRLIEVDLPIRTISGHARRDQNIRKGHLHTMHVWWATRPLASCRAVTLATMLPDPVDEACPQSFRDQAVELLKRLTGSDLSKPMNLRQALLKFVGDFADWAAGVNPIYLEVARGLVAAAHLDGKPMVLDPFAGAGSIPFESLRLGADAFAGDLNPIPVLLNKVALEYLPRYGHDLADGVRKWGQWVLDRARERLGEYYPADEHGHIPLAYIWARTIRCEGPGCGAEVPLLGMLWLSKKKKNPVALRYHGDPEPKRVEVEIFHPKLAKDVQPGIVNRMAATCPCCGYTTPYKNTREQLRQKRGGTNDARMVAMITLDQNGGRYFRLPTDADRKAAEKAARDLVMIQQNHTCPLSWTPDEPISRHEPRRIGPLLYGMDNWADMYLPRQALALGTFCQLVGEARSAIINEGHGAAFADAVATCTTMAVTNALQFNCGTSYWSYDHMQTAFTNNGLPMKPDFAEANPLMLKLVGGVEYALGLIKDFLAREGAVFHLSAGRHGRTGTAQRSSATHIPLPDDSVGYVVTDPPYYDAVPYSALSDFCYVWLKRTLRSVYPDLFEKELTTDASEIVVDRPHRDSDSTKDLAFYERELTRAFADSRRVLMPSGLGVILFASKTTSAWEATLKSVVDAGFIITASWPIDTERAARMQAKNRSVLGSTVHIVCRPRENPDGSLRADEVGDWRDVMAELPKRIQEWMPRLTAEGIVGADAIFACLGPALEIFSRYSRVEKASGEEVSLRNYLEQVWAAVAQEALRMLFEGADTSAFEEDARLTAMWLWTLKTAENGNGKDEDEKVVSSGGYVLEYDAARKIAQGLGAHLDALTTLVVIIGDEARLLPVDERSRFLFGKHDVPKTGKKKKKRQQMSLFAELDEAETAEGGWGEGGAPSPGRTILDRVHQAMLLFASGRGAALRRFLVEESIGRDNRFWTLAQALSALYPSNTQEKRWVDGVLARKKGMGF